MAIRKCPACLTTALMSDVAAHTDDFVCAGCGQHLQVQQASRVLASTLGMAAAYLAVRLSPHPDSTLGWAAPALFGLLGYGGISALITMATADLKVISAPSPAPAGADSGHGGGHGQGSGGHH
jgi:hypothetical protein